MYEESIFQFYLIKSVHFEIESKISLKLVLFAINLLVIFIQL